MHSPGKQRRVSSAKAAQYSGRIKNGALEAVLTVRRMPLAQLKPDARNPRIHPDPDTPAWEALKRSLVHDYFDPLGVNSGKRCARLKNVLWSGHLRLKVLAEMGVKSADVIVKDYTDREHRARLVAANRQAGEDDEIALANLLNGMDGERLLTGLAEDDMAALLRNLEPENPVDADPQMDRAEALCKEWGVESGQLWQLGEHRLLCGDCIVADDVQRVMYSKKADIIFTDPPYVHKNNDGDLIQNWEKALGVPQTKSSKPRPMKNDGAEANDIVRVAFSIFAELLVPGGVCCCGGGGGPDPQFARWSLWLDAEIPFKMCVVWDKGGLGMGWHYRRNWECVLIAQKPGGPCKWYGGNDVPNVIRDIGKIIPSAEQHPTVKPVELVQWFLRLHTQEGDEVFDGFSGSGTTLIACENLKRRCRAIEIDPGYVAVSLQRYFAATGKKPTLLK